MKAKSDLKVALVHDYLREYGGAERVLEQLHEIYPTAPVYTAYFNPEKLGIFADKFKGWDIRTSWIQRLPFSNKLISPLRIMAPMVFEGFDLKAYDVVISSCNIYFAKAVITPPAVLHISYIHSPPRYLYGFTTSFNYKKHWWTRVGAEIINHFLRVYDFETSQRPDILVANSKNVAARIKKFYRRDSHIIYPPIDISMLNGVKADKEGNYFLSLSRLSKGKGIDLIIKACSQLGVPLKVVGNGAELENFKKIAGSTVEFMGAIPDSEKAEIYANAKALIVASEDEDFGITAVEAQACGTPVIAIRSGGYLESVIEGKTGEFFDELTVESLSVVVAGFDKTKYKIEDCIKQSTRFSAERFRAEIEKLVESFSK